MNFHYYFGFVINNKLYFARREATESQVGERHRILAQCILKSGFVKLGEYPILALKQCKAMPSLMPLDFHFDCFWAPIPSQTVSH